MFPVLFMVTSPKSPAKPEFLKDFIMLGDDVHELSVGTSTASGIALCSADEAVMFNVPV